MTLWSLIDQELVQLQIVQIAVENKDLPVYTWISRYTDEIYETTKT